MEVIVKTLFFFALLSPLWSSAQDIENPCFLSDLGFVMDVSDTISERNFDRQKMVLQGLVKAFEVKLGGSRAGLITFSTTAHTRIEIGEHATAAAFNQIVENLPKTGGNTYIDRALIEATDVLFGNRYREPQLNNKILIVVSDGKQTGRNVNLRILTRSLRHLRVRIIAVAMGDHTDRGYLEQLVANPGDIVYVRTQADIEQRIDAIHLRACIKQPGFIKKCSKRIDLGFVLDASGSIGRKIYERVKKFATDLLAQFHLSRSETNAAVIVYSTAPKLVIKLNEFYDLEKFSKALSDRTPWPKSRRILSPEWMGAYTRIDLALAMAKNDLFTTENGDREDVRNALIFLTDGEQKPQAEFPLDHYAKPLKDDKVNIIAVGFGKANENELKKIASGPEFVLSYKGGVEVLEKAVGEIVDKLCNFCETKVNLGFVLDSSRTAAHKFEYQQKLVKRIADRFVLQAGGSQAALVTFSDEARVDIQFTPDLDSFKIDVDFLTSTRGRTYIDKGLRAMGQEFDRNAVPGRPNILLVMTDGMQSENVHLVKEAADDLRRKGFVIFAISTSDYSNDEVLKYIAGEDDNILQLKENIIFMETLATQVVRKSCPNEA